MTDQAATPAGGAEVSARPDASANQAPASTHDRLKAFLGSDEPEEGSRINSPAPEPDPAIEAPPEDDDREPEPDKAKPAESEAEEGAQEQEQEFEPKTLNELAQALGWDIDRILDLEAATKVDGKDGTRSLRDLIKSHQLEQHLNSKLMTFADEKKAFETERQTHIQQSQHKLMQMDAAIQVATRMLQGEFAGVDWQKLQDENPLEFNQRYVAFQQRQAQLNQMADLIGRERQQAEAQAAEQRKAYLKEQSELLDSKLPEWTDKAHRAKDVAEMIPLVNEAYGVTEAEVKALADHRELLILRDAWQWQKLQRAKPAIVNKVKTAPKLLKPGAVQSRAAQDSHLLQQDRDRLRRTGKDRDAAQVFKRLGIV